MWLSVLAMLVLGTIALVVTSGLRDEPVRVALAMILPVVFMLRGIKKRSLSISGAVAGWAVVCTGRVTGAALAGFCCLRIPSLPANVPSPSALNLVRLRPACAQYALTLHPESGPVTSGMCARAEQLGGVFGPGCILPHGVAPDEIQGGHQGCD
jgi:hypothetical protein